MTTTCVCVYGFTYTHRNAKEHLSDRDRRRHDAVKDVVHERGNYLILYDGNDDALAALPLYAASQLDGMVKKYGLLLPASPPPSASSSQSPSSASRVPPPPPPAVPIHIEEEEEEEVCKVGSDINTHASANSMHDTSTTVYVI